MYPRWYSHFIGSLGDHAEHEGGEDVRQDVGTLRSAECCAWRQENIDGACVLTESDGDKVFSTFDTRDIDKSQPDMNCGTHIITGGTGKYAGITGKEPFKCINLPALAGSGGYTTMDIPHNTTWEIVTGH